jgi:hypothetical protein
MMRSREMWAALMGLVASSACATTLYEGPQRPVANAATIESKDTLIDEVDGKNVQGIRGEKTVYVLPPGPHVLGVSVRLITPGLFVQRITTSRYIRVCLVAAAGHRYVTTARIGGRQWQPEILDRVEGELPTSCDRARLFPDATAAPAAAEGAAPEVIRLWSEQRIERARARPFLDLTLNLGAAFGGSDLLTAQFSGGDSETLSAGQGLGIGLGAMLTPLWLADRIGLGLGGEIDVKYESVSASNADVSFTRYPAIGTLHALVRVSENWFLLAAGGVEKDLGVNLSGSGDAANIQATLTSRTGGVGRLGLYYRWKDLWATTFGLGYTKLTYDAPGGSVSANSFSFWMNLHYTP